MTKIKAALFCFAVVLGTSSVNAQGLLNRLKQKAADAAEKAIDKKTDDMINGKKDDQSAGSATSDADGNVSSPGAPSNRSSNRPTNKGGAGLVTTPPDVKENLSAAESSYKSASYGEARYAIQQAMLGVEMEIGLKILKSLPESASGLPKQADKDQVTSSGFGWTGLNVQREYLKDDKQLTFTLANNSVWMSAVNMFLTNGRYAQTTGGEQNWKQIQVKGNKSVIEYNENSGYKLSIPLGQTSILLFQGINFTDEQELMSAVNQFDIDGIKKTLGEK